jgi:hypothetical protein
VEKEEQTIMTTIPKEILAARLPGGGYSYLSQMYVIPSGVWEGSTGNIDDLIERGVARWYGSRPRSSGVPVRSHYWTDPVDWSPMFDEPDSGSRVLQAGTTVLVFRKVPGANFRWLEPTLDRVELLMALDPASTVGRDTPPSPESVIDAVTFLTRSLGPKAAPPSLAPLNDGGLQAEWHRGGLDVEIVFSPDDEERGVYIRHKQTGEEQELPLDAAAFKAAVGDSLNVAN